MASVNWDSLKTALSADLTNALRGLVVGAATDLQNYANQISSELVLAMSTNDQDTIAELKAQVLLLAE